MLRYYEKLDRNKKILAITIIAGLSAFGFVLVVKMLAEYSNPAYRLTFPSLLEAMKLPVEIGFFFAIIIGGYYWIKAVDQEDIEAKVRQTAAAEGEIPDPLGEASLEAGERDEDLPDMHLSEPNKP